MNYLVVQQWASTKGNHAGMSHMCDMLVSMYPDQYEKIELQGLLTIPQRQHFITKFLLSKFDLWIYTRKFHKAQLRYCNGMLKKIKDGDKIFLLEYHHVQVDQLYLANYLKKTKPQATRIALSHLSPSHLEKIGFGKKALRRWSNAVDIQLTLGTSLAKYLVTTGIPEKKIQTGFHYVDNNYYKPSSDSHKKTKLTAITMGNLHRNYVLLSQIVQQTPYVNWIICCGEKIKELRPLFAKFNHVLLKPKIPENELKQLMNTSDISVNVLEDTIGSNVITTSMAMGLAIIASDVGSIRDYCDVDNCIFCQNTIADFTKGIHNLATNPHKLNTMKKASLAKTSKFEISKIHNWLNSLNK